MKEGRGDAVKLEGGVEVCPQIIAIVDAGIPVCAHKPIQLRVFFAERL